MSGFLLRALAVTLLGTTLACSAVTATSSAIPDPVLDAALAATKHQDHAARHPDDSYIVMHDLSKVASHRRQFPTLYITR